MASGYNVYAENTGLGFASGVPLLVGSTGAAWGDPPTSWMGYLQLQVGMSYSYVQSWYPDQSVNTAIQYYNQNNGGPDIPLVDPPNFFDDGFGLPMAVTVVNNDLREGPYSNVAQIRDVTPPTVADQGDGFDTEGGLVPTYLPWLVVDEDTVGLYPDEPLPGLGDPEIGDGNTYDAARYAAWLATPRNLDIGMNEDLLLGQGTPGAVLSAIGGGGETTAGASITQYEIGG